MKLNMTHIGDDALLAYVDGQLDAAERKIIETHLATHPEDAAKVAEWQQQSGAIEALFSPVANEPVPARLDPHTIAKAGRPANDNFWRMAAAAMVLLAFGSGLGWYARDFGATRSNVSQTMISAAVIAHELFAVQPAHAVEVRGDDVEHLTAWLSTTLDRRLAMPDLSAKGYTLLGGRILPATPHPAAQVMYAAANGERVTLYLTPRAEIHPDENRFAEVDGLDALYWANDAVTCTIVGDLSRAEMEDIASEVFKALNWKKQPYRRS